MDKVRTPFEGQAQETMARVKTALSVAVPSGSFWIAITVEPRPEGAKINCMSNADTAITLAALKHMAQRIEGGDQGADYADPK
jgi:hypothetical protein